MAGYASYGFCEAHAAAFATTSFKTAYLLRHHPAEYYATILNNQPMGYYPANIIGLEAHRRGIEILPPDINFSGLDFTLEDDYGLSDVVAFEDIYMRYGGILFEKQALCW